MRPPRKGGPLARGAQGLTLASMDGAIREVLLATDFSPHSQQAAKVAGDLARKFGARLHVLHVVREAGDRPTALAELARLAEPLSTVVVGSPPREIVHYASREHVDLIVMGTHGRGGLSRAIHGSVTERVIRNAPCQVLAVKLAPPEVVAAPPAAPEPVPRRCLLCARESGSSICAACTARIQAEAVERKRREMHART